MKIRRQARNEFLCRLVMILMIISLMGVSIKQPVYANGDVPPEESRDGEQRLQSQSRAATLDTYSAGIAWGDPEGLHSVYTWPYSVVQMGHVIQSYQNYSSGTSSAYFHHGIDMIAPDGTDVFTRSGGQVVNVENYTPGNDLYWEVAILDTEGYVWQYHHLDKNTIPQAIHNAFAAYQANPATGGVVPANTYIGDIVYWTVTSFGYRFNHIHLNILAAGDVYLNPLEFHTPLSDTQSPEIQAIGLLNGNTLVSGTTASGNYGMYVRARDLFLSSVYYLPPYKTEFSIDGGAWTTVWEFDDLPGGASDTQFVNDYYIPNSTTGNYSSRNFYIDLGFTPTGQRSFPSEPGAHTIQVRVWDYNGNSTSSSFNWTVVSSIPDNGCTTGNGVTRTFEISDDLSVTDVNLGLNISHATRGQLRVSLKAPSDTVATNVVTTASDSYDHYDVLLDDASSNALNDGNNDNVAAPYFDRTAGPRPDGSLNSFNGKSALGTWTVFVCDNTSGTTGTVNQITLSVAGTPTNTAPVISQGDSVTVPMSEDGVPTPFGLTVNAVDAENNPLTWSLGSAPTHGVATVSGTGASPTVQYLPTSDYFGTDSFTIQVSDGSLQDTIVVNLVIDPVNDAPVAVDNQFETVANTASLPLLKSDLLANDTDLDTSHGNLSVSSVLNPINGTMTEDASYVYFTPTMGFVGTAGFDYEVSDGLLSDLGHVTIQVNAPPNVPPVVYDQTLSIDEDGLLEFVLSWSDPDSEYLTFTIVTPPANGTLGGDAPELEYQGNPNFSGTDSFTYFVNDGVSDSNLATVSITILPMNDMPFANDLSVIVEQNSSVDFTLAYGDVDGDPVTYWLYIPPAHGTLSGTAPNLTYTPTAGYVGPDSFEFYISESNPEVASAFGIVDINVITPPNVPPVAYDQTLTIDEDDLFEFVLSWFDPDSDNFTFTIVTPPANGTLRRDAPELEYQGNLNFSGTDSFTYFINDGVSDSNLATVSIIINAVNDHPYAEDQTFSTNEDVPLDMHLIYGDVEGDPTSYWLYIPPLHGTLSGTAPDLVYTPNANYFGPDSFQYLISGPNPEQASALGIVSITVNPVNDAPFANNMDVDVQQDSTVDFTLVYGDVENDPVTFTVTVAPLQGTLSGTAPNLTYTPTAGYVGPDGFEFAISDPALATVTGTVSINVTAPPNIPPVAHDQTLTIDEDDLFEFVLSWSDPDSEYLTFTIVTPPANGTLGRDAPELEYQGNLNFSGTDSFTYFINDGVSDSNLATVSITILPMNDMPFANDLSVEVLQNSSVDFTLVYGDVDGDPVTYWLYIPPAHGTLSGTAPNLTYTPTAGYAGPDSFEFYISESNPEVASAFGTVFINVTQPTTTIVFSDDFETNLGWVRNPNGTDNATSGLWEWADPQAVNYSGPKQLGTTPSGSKCLVTGAQAGRNANSNDVDGGTTSIRSPQITLPSGADIEISFKYYFAHYSISNSSDFLRVSVVGDSTKVLYSEFGAFSNDNASWATFTGSLNEFAGQQVYILIETADRSYDSLIESALDDIQIVANY